MRENAASILDAVVDAILTIDVDGIILSHNSAVRTMFGYATEELIGENIGVLMPEPLSSMHDGFVEHYLRSKVAKIIGIGRELPAVKKNGEVFPIYLAVSEIVVGETSFFVGIIRDLTEQKRAHDALLEQKDRAAQVGRLATMGEMTASIAHEINQPLTAIAMYAQASVRLLEKPDTPRDKVIEVLGKLNAQSLRAGAVIERIQQFVQNVGGSKAMADINQLLRELNHLAAGDARLHGIELTYLLVDNPVEVYCDPVQIQQVVLNLVRNAIDAMYEIRCANGCDIVIRTVLSQGEVVVTVEDSGPGVDEEVMTQVFNAFFSTKESGMGMGLAICKTIIEDHGGTLSVENLSPEPGAKFFFTLPMGIDDE